MAARLFLSSWLYRETWMREFPLHTPANDDSSAQPHQSQNDREVKEILYEKYTAKWSKLTWGIAAFIHERLVKHPTERHVLVYRTGTKYVKRPKESQTERYS